MGMEALGSAVRTALGVILELVENGRKDHKRQWRLQMVGYQWI